MNLCQYLSSTASVNPNKVLAICGEQRSTASVLAARVAAISASLVSDFGVEKGDRVVLAALNSDLYLEVVLGVFAAGAVVAPLNWRWSLQDAAAALKPCMPCVLVVDKACSRYLALQKDCHSLDNVILLDGTAAEAQERNAHSCLEMISRHNGAALTLREAPEDIAVLCFTSGTTGPAKAAALTHTAFHCQALAKVLTVGYCESDIYLHSSPLCHVGALSSAFTTLLVGATHVFIPQFSQESFISMVLRHQVTAFIAVPAMLADVVSSSHVYSSEPLDFVKRILVGAGALSPGLQAACQLRFPGASILTAYGMTEACSSITFQDLDLQSRPAQALHGPRGASCVGRPPPGIEVCIHGQGDAGEVWTRGPNTLLRYWGVPAPPLEPGGWFRTGDLGALDSEGRLWLVGRLKDVIRSGGENVHASEVEAVLEMHPDVLRAAAVGIPHKRLGEQVAALLQLRTGCMWSQEVERDSCPQPRVHDPIPTSLSIGELLSHCERCGLSRFKLPRIVMAQHNELPVNATGKVVKHAVRDIIVSRSVVPTTICSARSKL